MKVQSDLKVDQGSQGTPEPLKGWCPGTLVLLVLCPGTPGAVGAAERW
jgi:hypothetical protein